MIVATISKGMDEISHIANTRPGRFNEGLHCPIFPPPVHILFEVV
jgi:hypothetical protein